MSVERLLEGTGISPTVGGAEGVVDLLEALLVRARRGEITGIGVAISVAGGGTATAHVLTVDGDVHRVLHATETSKLRLLGTAPGGPL